MDNNLKQAMYTVRWYGNNLIENPHKAKETGLDLVVLATEVIDGKVIEEEPERPTAHYEMPKILDVDVDVKTHGKYRTPSGMPKGLIVHFTAGRNDSLGTLKYMKSVGLGCMVMDESGEIIKGQEIDEVAWHAGTSKHPSVENITGMSRYCMGMEICNPGKLTEIDDPSRVDDGMFYSWFGTSYNEKLVRYSEGKDNIRKGYYLPFTDKQEFALINFCKWQISTNPEFDIEWVLGHDEVAPGRKSDPGGALSMTMPEFRQLLRDYKQSL